MKVRSTQLSRQFFNSPKAIEKVSLAMKTGKSIENLKINLKGRHYKIAKDDYKQTIAETGVILAAADRYIAKFEK